MASIEIPDTVYRLLDEQAKEAGLPLPELIRRAVSSYIRLNEETSAGQTVSVTNPATGTVKEIALPLLKR